MARELASLGDVFANLGNRILDRTERQIEQARQERLINEQRNYDTARTREQRAWQEQTQIESEKRSLINGLVAAGLLAPGDVGNQAAIAAAFQKATPEWKRDFQEKKDLKDELNRAMNAGILQDYDTETDDLPTLRSMAAAVREAAGKEHMTDVGLERKYKESAIAENDAQAKARVTAEQMQRNREYWSQRADEAAADYESTTLTPAEMQQAQALAAAAAGPQANDIVMAQALEKATAAVTETKKRGALLRYQNAQRAMQYGTGIPTTKPGASIMAPTQDDGTKAMQGFMGAGGSTATPPPAATPQASNGGSGLSTLATVGSMLPLEKGAMALGATRLASVIPPVRAAVLGYQAGDALSTYFPNNPLARIGRAAGRDFAEATGIGPGPQDFRRPLGASVVDPYGR